MIDTKPTHNTTHLTVLNYSSYQDIEHKDETKVTQRWHESDTKVAPNNNGNNVNNGNKVYRKIKHLTLSISEFDKLLLKYSKSKIDSILDDMENYAKIKNYNSAYLTASKWLSMRAKDSAPQDRPMRSRPE